MSYIPGVNMESFFFFNLTLIFSRVSCIGGGYFVKNENFTICGEEATSISAGFHSGPLSWSNLNFQMPIFVELRRKTTDTDKNTRGKSRPSNNLNPHMAQGRNRSRATLMRDERSHHCAILAPPKN